MEKVQVRLWRLPTLAQFSGPNIRLQDFRPLVPLGVDEYHGLNSPSVLVTKLAFDQNNGGLLITSILQLSAARYRRGSVALAAH